MVYIKSRKHAAAPSRLNTTAAAALLAIPVAVCAQQAPATEKPRATQTLPEVTVRGAADASPYKADTVSSPKFTQPLVDTPQTIVVIKKEVLQQQGTTSLSEALRNTPGITLQLGENGNSQTGDSIFMRGFDTSSSIFVDGVRDLGAISRDIFNIEQVEVIKGPSGSDIGRGNSSGYVNLVSKTPQRDAFNNASVSIGTAKRVRASADLNQPLALAIPGSAIRLNLMAQDYGQPGRDEVKNKRWGFAPSLAFGLGTPTRATFSYLHVDQNNVPDGGVSTFGLPGYRRNPGSPTATPPVAAQNPGPAVDPRTYYGVNGDYDDVKLDMFTARFEHDLAAGYTLRNITRIGRTEQTVLITGLNAVTTPGTSYLVSRSRQGRHQNNEILANQTNLTADFATGAISHSLSTGFEFMYERQRTQNLTTGSAATTSLYAPDRGATLAPPVDNGAFTRGNTLSAAVYAFDTLKLSEQWMVNAGVRWERFNTETSGATFATATGTTASTPQALTDNLLTGKLGAVFKPASNGSIYVTYATSAQPPGGANFSLSTSTTNQANASLDPQEGSNLEIGTKWDLFDSKLAVTAAVYRAQNKNELILVSTSPDTYAQVGKRQVDGVELGVVGQLTPALNLSAGLAYMDAEIKRGTTATQGNVIVFSPKVTFTSWLTYKLPAGVTVGGGVRYVDTAGRSSNNVTATTFNLMEMPDYWVADAYVAYEVSKNLSLQLNVNNLADKEYMNSLNNGGSRYRPGEARNALLTANLKF